MLIAPAKLQMTVLVNPINALTAILYSYLCIFFTYIVLIKPVHDQNGVTLLKCVSYSGDGVWLFLDA